MRQLYQIRFFIELRRAVADDHPVFFSQFITGTGAGGNLPLDDGVGQAHPVTEEAAIVGGPLG